MKKISLAIIAAIILALSFSTAQAHLITKQENGKKLSDGSVGYNYLFQVWPIYSTCEDPGESKCPHEINNRIFEDNGAPAHQNDALNYAQDQIAAGVLTGSDVLYGTTNVEWNSTDVDRTTCLIKVWDITETEPVLP